MEEKQKTHKYARNIDLALTALAVEQTEHSTAEAFFHPAERLHELHTHRVQRLRAGEVTLRPRPDRQALQFPDAHLHLLHEHLQVVEPASAAAADQLGGGRVADIGVDRGLHGGPQRQYAVALGVLGRVVVALRQLQQVSTDTCANEIDKKGTKIIFIQHTTTIWSLSRT